MIRCCAAATADYTHKPLLQHRAHHAHHIVGRVIIATVGIGQTGIRMTRQKTTPVHGLRHIAQPGQNFVSTEAAIQTDGKRMCIHHRLNKSFYGLPRKDTAGSVAHRHAYHQRERDIFHRSYSGFDIQHIGTGLQKDGVHSTLSQCFYLLAIDVFQLIECQIAKTRQGDVRGERKHLGRWPHIAQNKTWTSGLTRIFIRHLTCQTRCGQINLSHQPLAINGSILQTQTLSIERTGGDNVGTGFQILPMNIPNHLRAFDSQNIRQSLVFRHALLHQRAHGPVQKQHTIGKTFLQRHFHTSLAICSMMPAAFMV